MASMKNADIWKSWEKFGRSEFVKIFKQTLRTPEISLLDYDTAIDRIHRHIYDLVWKCLRGRIPKEAVITTFSEILLLHWDLCSQILDILNVIDAETSVTLDGLADERQIYCQLVKDIDRIIPDKLLKERLEIDTLQEVGTVKNKIFYTKFIKIKTKLYYKQRRFNLFREESEGYAKLITELNLDSESISLYAVLNTIKSLIGCFNLDPNRVLDIILESFETRPERHHLFIPLLQSYMSNGSIICEVLGYKYRYFSEGPTPLSLYKMTALLLKHAVIKLEEIYIWLFPTDKIICEDWENDSADAKEFVRKLNIISTNKDKEKEADAVVEKDLNNNKYVHNQKWGLCEAVLKAGDWITAQQLIKNLPDQCAVVNEPIAQALAAHIDFNIDALYRKKCFSPGLLKTQLISRKMLTKEFEVNDFQQLRQKIFPMIAALGPSLHHDCILLQKLIRIMRTILIEMNVDHLNCPKPGTLDEVMYFDILSIVDTAFLPSLSYLDCNCCVAEEIWTVIRYFPYQFRYSLYSRWKNETYLCHPMLIRRRGIVQKNIKALMKRVSKENVKPVGRLIGKLSHSAPGFLFDYILLQIQIYDNLISPVVDSLKYLTSLSYDMLGYCLIESLAVADRDRFKHDGTSLSMWLQSLANFCGAIYKKYNIELSGLLQYVANQLKSHKSLDLLILKEVVQKMTGIEAAEEMTNEQLYAMSGGELLRGEAGYFSQVRNTKKSSQRLKDALASNDLSVTLCLLMAQQKHCVIYRETAHNHLKLVGRLYDQCQDTLVQFGTFLGSTYSVDEYVERLPSIHSMLQEYHIHSDVAFFLARPMFSHQINQKYDQLRKSDPNTKKLTTSQKLQKYLDATAAIMDPIVESVRPLHFPKVWEDISPQFLVTFWSLSMFDLQVPVNSYQKEITKLKQLSLSSLESKEMNLAKGKKEQERYIVLMEKLQDERKKHQEHVDKIYQRLSQEKDAWFLSRSAKSAKNETISQFLQLCLFPRCTFTALDAIYCAKFVHTIHNLKAANFSTLLCYDRIFCDITYSVTSCTENEATRYGRFLCAMLETVMKWHADQTVFNKECSNYPGFVTKFRVSNQFSEANDHVGYENYRHVCHKWHYKITKAILFCLDSKDFVQIRNALMILMRILPYFPVLTKLAQIIERKVEKVREEEKNHRPDLFVLASSYIGQLKTKSPQMIKENDFHQVSEKPNKEMTIEGKPNVANGDTKSEKREKDKLDKKTNKLVLGEKEVKYDPREEQIERHFNRELRKEEKSRDKEKDKDEDLKKKDKRKDYRLESPILNETAALEKPCATEYCEFEKECERERDLSSVSNSSAGSVHRRNLEVIDGDTKKRKMDLSACKRSDELNFDAKKERSSKTRDRKDKLSDEEKDSRKDRKLGRKRERVEESTLVEHKRRREGNQNGGDEDSRVESKYHPKEKSPHIRELKSMEKDRIHEKFEREKQPYNFTKSSRSRIGY